MNFDVRLTLPCFDGCYLDACHIPIFIKDRKVRLAIRKRFQFVIRQPLLPVQNF